MSRVLFSMILDFSGEILPVALRIPFGACLAWWLLWATAALAESNVSAARETLSRQKGLVEQGGTWVLPLELELRRDFVALRLLQQAVRKSQQSTAETFQLAAGRNAALKLQMDQLRTRMTTRQAQSTAGLGPGQRRILSEQIKRDSAQLAAWRQQWIEPAQLNGFEPIKRELIKLTSDRNELATTILKIHEARPILAERYEQLAQDKDVRAALQQLGGSQRLGPLDNYEAKHYLAKLAEYEREVFTSELPLYRDGGALRVSALVGRTPVTFTWLESSEPTMLTASVIEAAGLEVPDDAPRTSLRFSDGQEVIVRQFEVPYLRFGNLLLRSVKAYALSPEAENVGAQIGPSALEGLSPRAEPEKLRLVLQ